LTTCSSHSYRNHVLNYPCRPWERLTHMSEQQSLSSCCIMNWYFSEKRLILSSLYYLHFTFLVLYFSGNYTTKTPKKPLQLQLFSIAILVNHFLTSLWIRNSYLSKGTIIDPLHLWVITTFKKNLYMHTLPGLALLKSR
jgi:hypothetical protein